MSTFLKHGTRAGLSLALLMVSFGTASAFGTDRAEWIRYLQAQQDQRAPVTAPATTAAVAAPARAPEMRDVAAPTRVALRGELPIKPGLRVLGEAPGQLPAVPQTASVNRAATRQIDPAFLPADISYSGKYAPGTIVIDTEEKYLYLVKPGGQARRYGVGVGRPGFQWAGTHRVSMKREWPGWTPPPQMRKRQPELPAYMEGGPENPLGARAMYLGNTLYRIHGSNAPWTIGHEVSSGCIRMRNEDVIELYEQVKVGTKVVVLR